MAADADDPGGGSFWQTFAGTIAAPESTPLERVFLNLKNTDSSKRSNRSKIPKRAILLFGEQIDTTDEELLAFFSRVDPICDATRITCALMDELIQY